MEKIKAILIQLAESVQKQKKVVLALSCLVVFITTYLLILPAFTLTKDKAAEQGGIDVSADVPAVEETAEEADAQDTEEASDAEVAADESDSDALEPAKDDSNDAKDSNSESVSEGDQSEEAAQEEETTSEPIVYKGDGYTVTVDDPAGVLPEDTTVEVEELLEKPDADTKEERKAKEEEYKNYYDKALKAVNEDSSNEESKSISFAKFYDITLIAGGKEIQPDKPVNVTITYDKAQQKDLQVEKKENIKIIHLNESDKTGKITPAVIDDEVVDITLEKSCISEAAFEAEGFSVYAVVYTVDFEYVSDVDGKTYEYSIKGGSGIGFTELLPVLGVIKDDKDTDIDEVEEFVDQIADARFSDPELVSISKTDSAATVGEIKESLGLECDYSADLTEEDINNINDKKIASSDWALISLKAFDTEETLTITMRNGDEFTVKVTDAQKPYTDASQLEPGKYIIYRSDSSGAKQLLLKNDGTSTVINPQTNPITSDQFSDYTWEVIKQGNSFAIKSTSNDSRFINLYGENNQYNQWSSEINWWEPAPTVNLSNGSKGIKISQGNKVLARHTTNGFYNSTDSSKATELIFYKIEDEDDPSGGSSSTPGIVLTDEERAEYERWKQTIAKWNTLSDYNKTAEVYDESNRIYKINIEADSGITDFYQDIDLGFVLDVSMSMKFPASLKALEDNGEELEAWLSAGDLYNAYINHTDEYNKEGCFYVISDPAVTSTIYKVYWDGSSWKYHDASLTDAEASSDGKLYTVSDSTVLPKDAFRMKYTLYYADDENEWSRFDYLKKSVDYSIATLKQIVRVTPGDQLDNTAAVRVAYNLFCKEITASETFKDLRLQTVHDNWNIPLTVANMGSGTQQNRALYDPTGNTYERQSANEFGWDNDNQQYVILITDGAPNGPSIQDVKDAAENLKRQYPNIKIFTIGLSTKDVDGGSQMLYDIADTVGGVRQFYEAEKAQDLEYILLRILRTIMTEGLVRGTVTDTIDKGFYPVDAQGNPLSAGVYNATGERIPNVQISDYVSGGKPTANHQNEAFYTWEQIGDEWKITWYNQEIGWDDNNPSTGNPWAGTVYVKAKEDYLGGNLIETNEGNAQIEPTGIKLVVDGEPEDDWRPLEDMSKIDLPVPRVNVHNLETKENSATWTVYKGTSVTPKEQLEALWNAIPIEEVVSSTVGNGHKITTGSEANVGSGGIGETFTLGSLMAEVAPSFNIDSLIDQITASKSSASQEFTYTAYGHESGKITVRVERTIGNETPATHTADTVGNSVEQYKVTFTYKPYTEAERMDGKVKDPTDTDHHNGSNGRGAEETGTMTSTNTHTINVFVKGLQITKKDENWDKDLTGAEFKLYKVKNGITTEVGGLAKNGAIFTIESFVPEEGATYYLQETKAPDGYNLLENTIPVTLNLNNSYTPKPDGQTTTVKPENNVIYDWTQTATLSLGQDYTKVVDADGNEIGHVVTDSTTGLVYYQIMNNPGVVLPHTGGIGTTVFYIFGSLLVLVSGTFLVSRRRAVRSQNKKAS